MRVSSILFSTLFAASLCAAPAFADEPDEATLKLGQRVFLLCRSCHTAEEDEGNKVGPNLWHVFGRKAGTVPDFKYSDAVKNSGIVWNEKTIDEWLTKPRDYLPGNKMAFRGVEKPEERAALIAFLKKETGATP
jgi:cytochrome c